MDSQVLSCRTTETFPNQRPYLIIIGPHQRQHRRNPEVGKENHEEQDDDGQRYVPLGVLSLLTGGSDGVKANKSVKARGSARHHSRETEGKEPSLSCLRRG